MAHSSLHIHLVSDSTGETVHQVARAALAQFPTVRISEHIWTLVRTPDHVQTKAALDRLRSRSPVESAQKRCRSSPQGQRALHRW